MRAMSWTTWLRLAAAGVGVGAAIAFGPALAVADDGSGGGSSDGGTSSSDSASSESAASDSAASDSAASDSRNATSTPSTETETETAESTAARVESDLTSRPSVPYVAKRSTASIARVEATQITVSRPQRDESDIAAMTPKIAAAKQAALRSVADDSGSAVTAHVASTDETAALTTATIPAQQSASTPVASPPTLPSPINVIGSLIFNAVVAFVRLFDPPPVIPPGSTVTRGTSTVQLPNSAGRSVDADWYFPNQAEEPVGLVYLNHGFFRSKTNMASLAVQLAERTNSIVVAPTISSNPFATDGYTINGEPMQRAVASLFAGDRIELTASASAAAGKAIVLPRQFVLSGHSAGGNLAAAVARYTTDNGAADELRAVVMLDGVDNGGAIAAAAERLDGIPIYQIAAECGLCNAFGSGTNALVAARPDSFVGVLLKGGTHVDAEGSSTSFPAALVCGFPIQANVWALQTIAADWITDVFTGSQIGVYGAGGQTVAIGDATAVILGEATPRMLASVLADAG